MTVAETIISPLLLACGLAVFALAMSFDMSDPQRLTRRTDIAFWLHLLAAPLIVHPLIQGFVWADGTPGETGTAAWPMLATFAVLGLVAVLVDRRALLVSGLAYAGIAFASLVRDSGVAGSSTPLTILVLGAFILLLSALWHPLRRARARHAARRPGAPAAESDRPFHDPNRIIDMTNFSPARSSPSSTATSSASTRPSARSPSRCATAGAASSWKASCAKRCCRRTS